MKTIKLLAAAVITLFSCQLALAQTGTDSVSVNFVTNATIGGMKEVHAGHLAEKNASNPQIIAYGKRMVTDHTKANEKLSKIAMSKGFVVPTPTKMQLKEDPMLTKTNGPEFDKNYVMMMIMDHQKTIMIFENAAQNAQDADIKAFAQQMLPTLKQHLAAIKSIASGMGISAE